MNIKTLPIIIKFSIFFYGDTASKSLEFPTYGIEQNISGFDYASQWNQKSDLNGNFTG